MKSLIILLPGFVSAYYCLVKGWKRAFISVFITSLLLLPQTFKLYINGLPELLFAEAAMLPIIPAYFASKQKSQRLNFVDITIAFYCLFLSIVEINSSSFKFGLTTFFHSFVLIWMPYSICKSLTRSQEFSTKLLQQVIWCLLVTLAICHLEWLTKQNLYQRVLDSFFPGQFHATAHYRFGMLRFQGPYSSAIFFGLTAFIAYCLSKATLREDTLQAASIRPFTVKRQRALLLYGLVGSLSRGPWIGAIGASILFGIKHSRFKMASLLGRSFLLLLLGTTLWIGLKTYQHAAPETHLVSSLQWRLQLIDQYVPLIREKPWLGWGSLNLPLDGHLDSIDNFYIIQALKRGLTGVILFLFIQICVAAKLIRLIVKYRSPEMRHVSDTAIYFLGILLAVAVTAASVWIDEQFSAILFFTIGWVEGFTRQPYLSNVHSKPSNTERTYQQQLQPI